MLKFRDDVSSCLRCREFALPNASRAAYSGQVASGFFIKTLLDNTDARSSVKNLLRDCTNLFDFDVSALFVTRIRRWS